MFVIPDIFLEAMTCDICYKVLSVGPVKVYQNRRTKCGRCSQADDDGVVSQYGLLAKQGLFKCVNRFDGCRQLLRYTQVADHESVCHSKTHICPVCSETTNIPTFLLIKHFEERHRDCLLEIPSFKVELSTPGTKTYLYRVRDNLFFIELKNISVDTICLNAHFLGDPELSGNFTQKFVAYYADDSGRYETEKNTCAVNSGGFLLKIPEKRTKYVFVAFHIDLGSFETVAVGTVGTKNTIGLLDTFPGVHVEDKNTIGVLETCPAVTLVGFPRTVSLTAGHDSKYSLGSSSTSVLVQNAEQDPSEFVLYCIKCSDMNFGGSFVEVKPKIYQLVCHVCYGQLTKSRIPGEKWLSWNWQKNVSFSCIWRRYGCMYNIDNTHCDYHEQICPFQPDQHCPVPNCSYEEKLWLLGMHFSHLHPGDSIIGNPRGKLYNFRLDRVRKRFYFWAYHGFVPIEVSWRGKHFQISLLQDNKKENTSRLQTRVEIFESETLIKTITDNNPIHKLTKWEEVNVQCFLKC